MVLSVYKASKSAPKLNKIYLSASKEKIYWEGYLK